MKMKLPLLLVLKLHFPMVIERGLATVCDMLAFTSLIIASGLLFRTACSIVNKMAPLKQTTITSIMVKGLLVICFCWVCNCGCARVVVGGTLVVFTYDREVRLT